MPVLYEEFPIHVDLPTVYTEVHMVVVEDNILAALRSLPECGLPHVRRMVLLGYEPSRPRGRARSALFSENGQAPGRYKHSYETVRVKMEKIWLRMHTELPKLRHIRVNLFYGGWRSVEDTQISAITGMIEGRNLEEVELVVTVVSTRTVADAVRLIEDAKAQLEASAAVAGSSIKVSTSVKDKEAEGKQRLAESKQMRAEAEAQQKARKAELAEAEIPLSGFWARTRLEQKDRSAASIP